MILRVLPYVPPDRVEPLMWVCDGVLFDQGGHPHGTFMRHASTSYLALHAAITEVEGL